MTDSKSNYLQDFLKQVIDTLNEAVTHADETGLSKRIDKMLLDDFLVRILQQFVESANQPQIKTIEQPSKGE